MENMNKTIAVIGGGLSGLTAARQLAMQGAAVTLFEKGEHVGGRTLTVRKQGFVFDTGAITMLPTYDQTCALIDELGIGDHLHRIAPVIGIPRNGQIHDLDLNTPLKSVLSTRLVTTTDKLRMWKLIPLLIKSWSRSEYRSLAPLLPWDNESVASWAERELNSDVHQYVLGPVIRGNTLNSTESAPLGELLWMLKGYSAPFVQNFDRGINFLAESLAQSMPENCKVQFGCDIKGVSEAGTGVTVSGQVHGEDVEQHFDACVVALSPLQLRELEVPLPSVQREFIDTLEPLPSVNFHFGLRHRPDFNQTFILPAEKDSPVLTTIVMDHNKAPGRAPEGKGVVSLFCRDDWCAQNMHKSDDELVAEVLAMAKPYIGDVSGNIECQHVQRWPYAIIKSSPGIYQKIDAFERAADIGSRVQIAGDFLSMGMEAAVCSGQTAAARTVNNLNQS